MTKRTGWTPNGIDLFAPGGIDDLLALHRSIFGDARMSVDAGSGSGGGDGGAGSGAGAGAAGAGAAGTGAAGTGGAGDGSGGSSGGEGSGSGGEGSGEGGRRGDTGRRGGEEQLRADLVSERDRRQAAERELQQLRAAEEARQREGEAEQTRRVRGELEGQLNSTRDQLTTLRGQLIARDARDLAVNAGVAPERWRAFARHVDLANLEPGDDGTVPVDALQARIDAGLEEAPEFRTVNTGGGTRRPAPGSGAGAGAPAGDLDAAVARALAQMGGPVGAAGANGATATLG